MSIRKTLGPLLVAFACLVGCGDAMKSPRSPDAAAPKDVAGADAGDLPAGPEVCTQITCNVDFPCRGDQQPACGWGNPSVINNYVTVDCAEICGTPCCSGAQCLPRPQACASGALCAYPSPPTSARGAKAECIAETRTCGGAEHKVCPSGQYCEHPETLCTGSDCPSATSACDGIEAGGLGICTTLPDSSTCDTVNPVCGCDGVTYENECARKAASAARAYTGACK
jgi:hypothetical protein